METLTETRPEWHAALPVERQGLWSAGDRRLLLAGETSWNDKVRIVLKDGTIYDGTMGEERSRWDTSRHVVAIRIPGRRTQKWIHSTDIAIVWGDKGESFEALLTRFLTKQHG